jgi:Ca-activated chloride channel homolog
MREKGNSKNRTGLIVAVAGISLVGCLICMLAYFTLFPGGQSSPTREIESGEETLPAGEIRLAYSQEKADLIEGLVKSFNDARYKTPDGDRMRIHAEPLDPQTMVLAAQEGYFQIVTPDSSIWLDQIDRAWAENTDQDAALVGQTFRYAVSPVVIAMWDDVAQSMGYPTHSIGWKDILERAQTDPGFTWSHASTRTASGLLATLAQFYAGVGKTRDLTVEDAQAESTLEYVSAIQKTVRYYGEGETALITRALEDGPAFLDAFVVQEQMVIYYNVHRKGSDRLTAIYPQEGTLWEDHPMALLEHASLRPDQRQVFSQWMQFLQSSEIQKRVLDMGYRPADLSIPLDSVGSPFASDNGVDPREPQTALQMPSSSVIDVVQNVWWYTKRHANVFLVVDVSGSMRSQKLPAAQEALRVFLAQIAGEQEAIGLIEFSSDVQETVPLDELGRNRTALTRAIETLRASGETSLLDAVELAHYRLQQMGDSERINAIVLMTDGLENDSQISMRTLERQLQQGSQEGVQVVIFCVAYGKDADYDTLSRLAEISGGQVREGDLASIQELYKILSTYF